MPARRQFGYLLVIEDNPDHWTILDALLKRYLPHLKTAWVTGAEAAVDYLNDTLANYQELPTLILLDLYLPRPELGLELLHLLKGVNSRYCMSPVVVLSHSSRPDDVLNTYEAGCTSYLVKPVTTAGWEDMIQKLKHYWWETVIRPETRYLT